MPIDITDSAYERGVLPARAETLGRSVNLSIEMTEGEILELRAGAGPTPALQLDGTVPADKVWTVIVTVQILEVDE